MREDERDTETLPQYSAVPRNYLPEHWRPQAWAFRNLIGQDREWTPTRLPRTTSTSINVSPLDDVILVSGNTTLTLETAIGADGRRHTIVKTDAATTTVTIATTGSQTINGASTLTLTLQYATAFLVSDGTNWRELKRESTQVVSVKDFGAVGNGTTDDTTAIQAAITYAQNQPAGVVYFPPIVSGTNGYRITAELVVSASVALRGASPLGVVIYGDTLASGKAIIHVDGTISPNLEFVEVSNMVLYASNSTPDLLKINRVANSAFRDIGLRGGRNGLAITGNRTFSNHYERIIFYTGSITRTVDFGAFTGGGQHTFVGCSFGGTVGVNVSSDSVVDGGLTFTGCNFEACAKEGLYINGSVYGLTLNGCRFEKNGSTSSDVLLDPSVSTSFIYGVAIHGCWFETDAVPNAIQFGGSGGLIRGFHIAGNYVQDYSQFVKLNGEGKSGQIVGNRLANTSSVINAYQSNVVVTNNEGSSGNIQPIWEVIEDTWTPALGFVTSGNLSTAYSVQTGRYVKLGNRVTADFTVVTSVFTHSSAAGDCQLRGLPYVAANESNHFVAGSMQWQGITKANYTDIVPRIPPNVSTIDFRASGSGQTAVTIGAADMPSGGSVILSGTVSYKAA